MCKPTKRLSDFSKVTERQMLSFEDACCLCNLAYYPTEVVKAVDDLGTKAELHNAEWRAKHIYWKKPGDTKFTDFQINFWENVYDYLHQPDLIWKLIDVQRYDTQVYIFCDSERLVLAWRGTESGTDALIDLRLRQIDWPFNKNVHGMVHRGFALAYGSARDIVRKQCLEFIKLKKPKMINITGHSLGAALCAINCIDFEEEPIAKGLPIYAVSVAMPPTVSPKFNKMVMRLCPNFTNLTNHRDPLVWMRHMTSLEAMGKDVWLKMDEKTSRISSHYTDTYMKQIELTRQHLKELGKSFAKSNKSKRPRNFNFLDRNLLDKGDFECSRRALKKYIRRRDLIDSLAELLMHI